MLQTKDNARPAVVRSRSLRILNSLLRKVLSVEIYRHTVNIEKISICLNRGREESVGNDDVSIVCARKYAEWLGLRKTQKIAKGPLTIGRFCDINCAVILRYSFALRVISVILRSSCYESYGPKDTKQMKL